jgi:hypothetical protein
MRIISTGNVGIGTNDPKALLHVTGKTIINSGLMAIPSDGLYGSDGERMRKNVNIGIGTNDPKTLLQIKGTNPVLTIMGQGNLGAKSQINLSTFDVGDNQSNCSIIATDNENFGATFQINQKTSGAIRNTQFTSLYINTSGGVGIGTTTPEVKLDVNGSLLVRAAALNSGGTSGVFFRNGYTASNYYNCSILTYDHDVDVCSDGLSINAWDGVSFCTGSNTRNERMRITNGGLIGAANTNPQSMLHFLETVRF